MSDYDKEEDYVKVCGDEDSDFMEFPLESDGTLLLSTIQSHFPSAIGLKYKASSGAFRGLRAVDNRFEAPRGGWGELVYYVTESEAQKRKIDDATPVTKKKVASVLLQDIAVFGLPWATTDDEVREYFEKYGELAYCEVKKDRATGKSRGYGFVRFKTEDAAQEALKDDHYFNGRRVDLRHKKDSPMKLFVGRVPSGTTKDDLWEYFSQFGELKDTYIPSPFRGFGFVTFVSSEVGNQVLTERHIFKGVRLNVDKGEESKSFNKKRESGAGSSSSFNMNSQNSQGQMNYYTPDYVQQSSSNPDTELKKMLIAYLAKQV